MKSKNDYDFWKKKGYEAGETKEISEKFCAGYIKKSKAKNTMVSFGEGKPDILVCKKNKNFEFYEVKPYLEKWKRRGQVYWNLVTPERRQLNERQIKKFREMIKNGLKVYVIYYNRFIPKQKRKKPKLTVHKHKGKPNPREVTTSMLKNLEATDPAEYFERWA